jgi:hypothetical protein
MTRESRRDRDTERQKERRSACASRGGPPDDQREGEDDEARDPDRAEMRARQHRGNGVDREAEIAPGHRLGAREQLAHRTHGEHRQAREAETPEPIARELQFRPLAREDE